MSLYNEAIGASAFRTALEEEMRARKEKEKKLSKKAIDKLPACSKAAIETALRSYNARRSL